MPAAIIRSSLALFAFAFMGAVCGWIRIIGFADGRPSILLLAITLFSIMWFVLNFVRQHLNPWSAVLFVYFPAFVVPLSPWVQGLIPAQGYSAIQLSSLVVSVMVVALVALLAGGLFPNRYHTTRAQRIVLSAAWLGVALAPFLLWGLLEWGWDSAQSIWPACVALTPLALWPAWQLTTPENRRLFLLWYPVMWLSGMAAVVALGFSWQAATYLASALPLVV